MSLVVLLYFFDFPHIVRLILEFVTVGIGMYGIYAQSMIYRIKARPSWDRITTNYKFFGVAYIGFFLVALISAISGELQAVVPLVSIGMLGALSQLFFSYEDIRTLDAKENAYQLQRTKKLLNEHFASVKKLRFALLVMGGVVFPLFVLVLASTASTATLSVVLSLALLLSFASEIADRFLFYTTVVPLGMAGGFFVGKQR